MTLSDAEIKLKENGYNPTREITVKIGERVLSGLEISCASLTIDDHCKKVQSLLPNLKVYFNPNHMSIYIEK